MTGVAEGTNLTQNSDSLGLCQDTLASGIVMNFEAFVTNFFTWVPDLWFTGLFALWSVFYFSEPLVFECTDLYNTMQHTYMQSRTNMFKMSRLLNNLSNNFDLAATNFKDVAMFMTSEHVVENDFGQISYNAGFATGRIFYYLLFTTEYADEDGDPVDPFYTLNNQKKPEEPY